MSHVTEWQSADAAANSQTSYNIPVGGTFHGVFSDKNDQDWVGVDLVAGRTYLIHLSGTGDNHDADTVLRVFDSFGDQVAINDDADLAAGQRDSRLSFTPGSDGVYYLSAGLYLGNPTRDDTGDYRLTLVDAEHDDGSGHGPGDSAGDELIHGGDGDDLLRGGVGGDIIRGGAGNDRLYGLGGRDLLVGGDDDDLLEGGDDIDILLGDSPPTYIIDLLLASIDGTRPAHHTSPAGAGDPNSTASVSADASDPSLFTDSDAPFIDEPIPDDAPLFIDEPTPYEPDPWFSMLTRDDVLAFLEGQLRAGNDVLRGGPGNDLLEGGAGDDELFGGDDDDLLIGDSSIDSLSRLLPVAVFNDDLESTAETVLTGIEDGDDSGLDNLMLMLIIEQLTAGDDVLHGGPGNDGLDGGFGDDRLLGGTGNDYLIGGDGDDSLDGGPGADELNGGAGNDNLSGGSGNDWMDGGAGVDRLEGGDGDDVLNGDGFLFFLFPEPEEGHSGAEDAPVGFVSADPSSTSIFVPWGDDILSGGAGSDYLEGGPGNDTLTGGAGADYFVFAPRSGNDRVTDFHLAEDRIDLSVFNNIFSLDDLALEQNGEDLVISLQQHGGGEITLQGVSETELTEAHFIFTGLATGTDQPDVA